MSLVWFLRKEHDEEKLSAYLDGELDERQALSVESHLAKCDACAALLEELRGTRSLLSALPQRTASRSFVLGPEFANQAQRPAAASRPAPARRFNLAMVPAVAFTLFVALVAVDFAGTSGSSDDSATNEVALSNVAREATGEADAAGGAAAMAPPEPNGTPATATDSGAGAAAAGVPAADEGEDSESSAQTAPATEAEPETFRSADGDAPDESPIAMTSEVGGADEDGGISALRILQVLAATAFIASGFYVFVWPRMVREGS